MGKLIDPERRERARRQRIERKKKILEVARTTFSKLPFAEVTLDSIGQAADVDRGVASMYYRTKEELFLLLLREELAEWYSALEAELDRADGGRSQSELLDDAARSIDKAHRAGCAEPSNPRLLTNGYQSGPPLTSPVAGPPWHLRASAAGSSPHRRRGHPATGCSDRRAPPCSTPR